MVHKMDENDIKQRLKDANLYEDNMPEDLMVQYFKALKNSETSIQEESEKSINESAEELLEAINQSETVAPTNKDQDTSKSNADQEDDDSLDALLPEIKVKPEISADSSIEKEEESNNNNDLFTVGDENDKMKDPEVNDVVLDIKKTPIGFNDMPKSENIEKNMLKIISHELKFIGIQNSKKFLTSNSETRIKLLLNYHFAAVKLRANYARMSPNMAPRPKAITAIDHSLCVNPVIAALKEEESLNQSQETYVSRSGRLTKRKVYNEADDSSQDAFAVNSTKRSKNDDEWLSKTSLTKPNKSLLKKSESPSSSSDSINKTITETTDPIKNDIKEASAVTPKSRINQRKPTNEEIMQRSSLFKDTPKKGRSQALVAAACEDAERMRKQEMQIEAFTNSLDPPDAEDTSEEVISVDDDLDAFQKTERKRVIPPLPPSVRRPIHGRKRGGGAGLEPLSISTTKKINISSSEDPTPTVNGIVKRTLPIRRASNAETRAEPSSSNGRGSKANMVACPLCSVSFPQNEVEEHASSCGEDMFPQPTTTFSRITCDVCDQVVPLNMEYEVHVKQCIEKHREQ